MEEIQQFLPGFEPEDAPVGESAAHSRWLRDLGAETEKLAFMMRKPTDGRPFVYEVRFDLIPAVRSEPSLVAKGFGEHGPVVAFYSAAGFLQLLRGFSGQLTAGKSSWYEDQYPVRGYEKKLARYSAGEFYRV